MGYTRFEIPCIGQGIFQHALANVSSWDCPGLPKHHQWFSDNLPTPALKPGSGLRCWFKDRAKAHIKQARKMAKTLRKYGLEVIEKHRDTLPDALYADDYQVVVEKAACEAMGL